MKHYETAQHFCLVKSRGLAFQPFQSRGILGSIGPDAHGRKYSSRICFERLAARRAMQRGQRPVTPRCRVWRDKRRPDTEQRQIHHQALPGADFQDVGKETSRNLTSTGST